MRKVLTIIRAIKMILKAKDWIILAQKKEKLEYFYREKETNRFELIENYIQHEELKNEAIEIYEA